MVKFKFMDEEIIVTDERDAYNKIRLQYEDLAEKARDKFIVEYKNNCKNLDDVIDKCYDIGTQIVLKAISTTVDILVENKFYTINTELFTEQYCQSSIRIWNNTFSSIENKYMNIVLDEKQQEEYRQYRKNSRGRWVGGGFGLQGAIKGAVQAGALNAATGLAHSAINMVGRIGSSIKASNKKDEIFKDYSTLDSLAFGLNQAVFYIHEAYAMFLEDNADMRFKYVTTEESEQASIIFSNVKHRNLDDKERIEIIKKLIDLNPYSGTPYMYAVEYFGDENREIDAIANYFGYNINTYKEIIIDGKLNNLKTDTEEETIEAKKLILKDVKRLGMSAGIRQILELDNKLKVFDKEAKTVDDIVFKTREEANLARNEKIKIETILSNTDMSTEDEVIKLKTKIENLGIRTNIVKPYIDDIDRKLREFDKNARTVENLMFNTREEADKARLDKKKIEKMVDNLDRTDEKKLLSIKREIENYELHLDSIDEIIDEIEEDLDKIDIQKRTVNGIVFKSTEEAELAKEEKKILDDMMKTLNIESENSLIKTLNDIESKSFKTRIVESYTNKLNNQIKKIYQENIKKAQEYNENKEQIMSSIIGTPILLYIEIYFFNKTDSFLRIIIGFFILCTILSGIQLFFENTFKLMINKKASKRVKRIRKTGKV